LLYNLQERQRRLVQACAALNRPCSWPWWPRKGHLFLGPLVLCDRHKRVSNPRNGNRTNVFAKEFYITSTKIFEKAFYE